MRILYSLLFIIAMMVSAHTEEYGGKLVIGEKIPEALGVDVNGDKVNTHDHIGKVMVISFWATWCPPCQKELPIIDNLQRIAGKEKLSVIAVNFGENGRTFRKFTKALGDVSLTFTHDKAGRIGKNQYGIKAIPHMVIVDHEGKIANIHTGYGPKTVHNIANEINELFRTQASSSL